MNLLLKREIFTNKSTIGRLYVNGRFECFTLEDVPRKVKVPGQTCIAAGTYKVIITKSNRFGVDMPLLLNVKDFEGVRIHWGNTDKDTDGCILVGNTRSSNFIGNSRSAYETLFIKLKLALAAKEEVLLTIVDQEVAQPANDKNARSAA